MTEGHVYTKKLFSSQERQFNSAGKKMGGMSKAQVIMRDCSSGILRCVCQCFICVGHANLRISYVRPSTQMDVTQIRYRSERSYQAEGVIQYSTSTTGGSCEVQTWIDLTVIVIVIVFSILVWLVCSPFLFPCLI